MNQQLSTLESVLTLAEASRRWGLDRKTIIWAYWKGWLEMRQSASTWLVEYESMLRVYGQPRHS